MIDQNQDQQKFTRRDVIKLGVVNGLGAAAGIACSETGRRVDPESPFITQLSRPGENVLIVDGKVILKTGLHIRSSTEVVVPDVTPTDDNFLMKIGKGYNLEVNGVFLVEGGATDKMMESAKWIAFFRDGIVNYAAVTHETLGLMDFKTKEGKTVSLHEAIAGLTRIATGIRKRPEL
jgi:hypothetical protein